MEKDYLAFETEPNPRRLGPSLPKLRSINESPYSKLVYTNTPKDIMSLLGSRCSIPRSYKVRSQNKSKLLSTTFFNANMTANKFRKNEKYIFKVNNFQNKRAYNQDRYCCIPILQKPHLYNFRRQRTCWQQCGYFAIFDGHGGSKCAEFLSENLNHYMLREKNLMEEPIKALDLAFKKIQKDFLELAQSGSQLDTSGSCAIVCLLFEDKFYLANVGDSHCIIYRQNSISLPQDVNIDHKPSNKREYCRIISNGGKLIREEIKKGVTSSNFNSVKATRIYPGSLNVSRTIGDIEAKLKKYGGLPNVISAQPEIFEIDTEDIQYIIMGSDGLFQGISKDKIHEIYLAEKENFKNEDTESFSQILVNKLVSEAAKGTNDNITIIFICFK